MGQRKSPSKALQQVTLTGDPSSDLNFNGPALSVLTPDSLPPPPDGLPPPPDGLPPPPDDHFSGWLETSDSSFQILAASASLMLRRCDVTKFVLE